MKNSDGKYITLEIARAIQENKEWLSEVDGLIGDGDHGINMNKGFTMFAEQVKDQEINFTSALEELGMTLMRDIGGSMGPLYGTMFLEMADKVGDAEEIGADTIEDMLKGALEGIKDIGGANVGDKTLVDTLEPAVKAYSTSLEEGKCFKECLNDMKNAAILGRDSTKDMVAKMGRASRLGERSRGVLDAGATSCCLILCSMADAIINII